MTRFLPRWRKATWALAIFTALMGAWIAYAIVSGIAMIPLVVFASIGFVVLGAVWLMSRSRFNTLIYGPNGEHVNVTEKNAARKTRRGWTYEPQLR
jgi:uncharacterized membrane protein